MKLRKFLYYFLNVTWGLPMTLIGSMVALFCLLTGRRPLRHAGSIYFTLGEYWGGVSFGLFFFVDKHTDTHTKNHEYGHSLQNAILGPFMPFIVGIPSAIRYWVFVIRRRLGKQNPRYESIWFEAQATKWGTDTVNYWKDKFDFL